MIVHGIPGSYVLKEGDILSIDCGAIIEGYHGDAAYTMAIGGEQGGGAPHRGHERACGRASSSCAPATASTSGRAVQDVAERAATRGARVRGPRHRTAMHEQPQVPKLARDAWPDAEDRDGLRRQPMVNAGSAETRSWTTTGAW